MCYKKRYREQSSINDQGTKTDLTDIVSFICFKTSRPVLANQEVVDHMVKDIEKLDNGSSGRSAVWTKTEKDSEDGFDNECKQTLKPQFYLLGFVWSTTEITFHLF